jgi:peptidoglycan/LPS O-acetylase OafA/YrhL
MPVELLGSFALFSFLALPCNLGVRRAIALMWCILSTKSSYFGFPAGFLIATAFLSNLRELERSGFGPIFLIAGLSLALTMRSPLAESLAFLDVAQWKNLTALFLVAGTAFTPWARTLMSNSWSLFWGRLSFPIYLVHLPIICSVGSETYILLQSRLSFWMVVLSVGGAVLCSSVITALLFDIVVERKLLRSARRLHRLAIAGILTPRSKGLM